ncbi:unnamed protein product [Rhizoctonia solani]|uniref:Laminin domain protein n=1 Tax=Rhizoctonia solani TaxID=456999 RepID=A0A8H3HUK8_9AGAM|nr:unnamed protein product [Rhizoctonia solani]
MVQSNLNATITPPSLPAYLASAHNLGPITGVPNDEEVKVIHATIRAVNAMSHIPGMHDPDLSIQLAKHLFDVQMAVYRSQYSFSLFPGDIVYTPPPLPSHIPVTLQPVVGAPSDGELKLVHDMVRALEGLANSPSMFDSDLSLKLSQHFFNINIARYIRDSMHGQLGSRSEINLPQSGQGPSTLPPTSDSDGQSHHIPSTTPNANTLEHTKELNLHDAIIETKITQEETNRLLSEAGETLKNVNRTLVSTQLTLFLAQGYHGRDVYFPANDRGELLTDHGLSSIDVLKLGTLPEERIARYLQFYAIGLDLIEDSEGLKIKSGKVGDATRILRNRIIGV